MPKTTPPRRSAWRLGSWGLNLALNLTLIWPWAEAGLAVATSLAAAVQVVVLMAIFTRRHAPLDWPRLAATAARTVLSALVMGAVVELALMGVPTATGLTSKMLQVVVPIALGSVAYCGTYRLLGGRELGMLVGGGNAT